MSQIVFPSKNPLVLPHEILKGDSEVRSESTHHCSGHDDCLSESQILFEKEQQLRDKSSTSDGSRFNSCCSDHEVFIPTLLPKGCQSNLRQLMELSLNEKSSKFTPTTPYVHKFRTEMCKNYELYGYCKFGDEVSI